MSAGSPWQRRCRVCKVLKSRAQFLTCFAQGCKACAKTANALRKMRDRSLRASRARMVRLMPTVQERRRMVACAELEGIPVEAWVLIAVMGAVEELEEFEEQRKQDRAFMAHMAQVVKEAEQVEVPS